jgi:hypothetical protein
MPFWALLALPARNYRGSLAFESFGSPGLDASSVERRVTIGRHQ